MALASLSRRHNFSILYHLFLTGVLIVRASDLLEMNHDAPNALKQGRFVIVQSVLTTEPLHIFGNRAQMLP